MNSHKSYKVGELIELLQSFDKDKRLSFEIGGNITSSIKVVNYEHGDVIIEF